MNKHTKESSEYTIFKDTPYIDFKTSEEGGEFIFQIKQLAKEALENQQPLTKDKLNNLIDESNSIFQSQWYAIDIIRSASDEVEKIIYSKKNRFNCIEPLRDVNWLLLPRTDLSSSDQIEDWYESIHELFLKLNSITDTQIEPLYEPIYYGEVDSKGKKIPTYIVVWDIHADDYGIDQEWDDMDCIREIFSMQLWKDFLVEDDEWADPEVDAIDILVTKFWVSTVWLENEFNKKSKRYKTRKFSEKRKNRTGIWKWLSEKGINYIGLEDESIIEASSMIMRLSALNSVLKGFLLKQKGIDLSEIDLSLTVQDFVLLYNKHKETIFADMPKLDLDTDMKFSTYYKAFDEIIEKFNNYTPQQALEIHKINTYISHRITLKLLWNGILWKILLKILGKISKKVIKKRIDSVESSDSLKFDIVAGKMQKNDITIKRRNSEWIELLDKNKSGEQVCAMVYWKAHIPDLIKQL